MADQDPSSQDPITIAPVQEYYGKTLQSTGDLLTSACTISNPPRAAVRRALAQVHDTVQARFYGCGSPIPDALTGLTVLDIGCGTGRDCYVLSQLVGPTGRVIGLDATTEQIELAKSFVAWHKDKTGLDNVEFLHGQVEDLASGPAKLIADGSVDLVVSNCVLNLVPNKPQLLATIFRLLKPGGELHFSDVFADRRIPASFSHDAVLRGECLAGAWYMEDFRRDLRAAAGCPDYRVVDAKQIALRDPTVVAKLGHVTFTSKTVRAFKLDLEDMCEDYGQAVIYNGGIEDGQNFAFDGHHVFQRGKVTPVCGNTADMLSKTRYGAYFTVIGDKTTHYGLFDCAGDKQTGEAQAVESSCC